MKALVVYESMFGNTEKVAQAVADGLGGRPGPRTLCWSGLVALAAHRRRGPC